MKTPAQKFIIIADSHKAFRKSFHELIQNINLAKNSIILEASDKNELIEILSQSIPDIIFIDFYLGQEQSCSIIEETLSCHPNIIIIALSFYDEYEYIETMLNAGVKGYLLKNAENRKIIEHILLNPQAGLFFSNEINCKMQVS